MSKCILLKKIINYTTVSIRKCIQTFIKFSNIFALIKPQNPHSY